MSSASPAPLAETLLLEGPDAGRFAHSQFSSDVLALPVGQWQFSAWLSAQGRVLALFHLARLGADRWLLLLRGGSAETLRGELQRYVFRLKLTLSVDRSHTLSSRVSDMPMHELLEEDGEIKMGCGDHLLTLSSASQGEDSWRIRQIDAGWPWLPDVARGEFLPPALSLHRIGAVALDKGCYPGQEIVARLHYRGGNKRRLCRVELSQGVPSGTRLTQPVDAQSLQLLEVVINDGKAQALAVCDESLLREPQALSSLAFDGDVRADLKESFPA